MSKRLLGGLLAGIVIFASLVTVPSPLDAPAGAGPDEDFSLAKTDNVGGEALIGEHVTYTLTATGDHASELYLYNLSFRDVLPDGVAYLSASPAPTAVLDGVPASGQTTLVWENVADLPADSTASISYTVDTNPDFSPTNGGSGTMPVGDTIANSAEAVASLNAFMIPDWDEGTGLFTGDFDGSATTTHDVDVIPFRVIKSGPGELLRGVHDAGFGGRSGSSGDTYTVVVENNPDYATDGVTLTDVLGPILEFLGCDNYYAAGDDNSTDVPFRESTAAADEEWAGSGPMATGTGTCDTPTSVDTVDAGLGGGLANTVVTWDLGDLAPAATVTVEYRAGIPMRANTTTWTTTGGAPTPASLDQGRNLDNNAGPSTNELDRTLNTDPELLSDGAPTATNSATAEGTYTPTGSVVTDDDIVTTEAEDVIITKAMTGTLDHGTAVATTLTVTTGEYRDFTDLVVRDLLPSALCYTGTYGSDTTPGGSNWATDDCPGAGGGTGTATSVRELSNGGPYGTGRFEIVWDQTAVAGLADLDSDQSIAIPYSAVVRTTYRNGLVALPGEPVLAGDRVSNHAEVSGPDFVVALHTNDGGADDEPGSGIDGDTTSAQLSNSLPSINKRVSAKAGPLADGAGATAATCGTSYGTISWQETVATGFGPDDIICFELGASFPSAIDYEGVVIQDLLPPGYTYIPGSVAAVGVDDLGVIAFDEATLRWDLGTVDNGGHEFRRVIAARVGVPDDGEAYDINANLQKMTHNQNGGIVFQYRDEVPVEWTEPQLDLLKGVKAVDAIDPGLDTGPHGADFDGSGSGPGTTSVEVQSLALVTFRIDVTNDGNKPALNTEIRDVLPTDFTCGDLVTISDSGTCGSGVITWTVASIAGGASVERTYDLRIPGDIEADQSWTNRAGVRTYQAATDAGVQDYFPRDNIDPGVTANTDSADDEAFLHTAAPTVAKAQASGIDEAGNGSNGTPGTPLDRATIGEVTAYTVVLTIPDGTTVHDGVVSDALHSSLRYFEGSARFGGGVSVLGSTVVSSDIDGDGDRLDAGTLSTPAVGSSGTVSYTLPTHYENPADGNDHAVTITFHVQLMAGSAGNTRNNSADFDFDDAGGSPQTTVASNTVQLRVVEPSESIVKTHTVPAGSNVAPGDTVTYQIVASNGSGSNVSVLHDAVIVDAVPIGITPVRDGGGVVSADGHLVASTGVSPAGSFTGTWSETNRTITWTQTDWATLASLDPGASTTFTYQAEVDDPATASGTISNTADIDGANLDATDPNLADGRTYNDDDTDVVNLPNATFVKDIEPIPDDGDDRATVTVGEPLDYDVEVTLPANTRAYDLTLFDDLPSGITFDSFGSITISGPCEELPGSGALTSGAIETFAPPLGGSRAAWFLGDVLANGSACTITVAYTVHVDDDASDTDTLINVANLRWNTVDEVAPAAPGTLPADYDGPGDDWDVAPAADTESILVVEPQLEIDEDVTTTAPAAISTCDDTPGNNRTGADDLDTEVGPTDGCDIEAGASLRSTITVTNSGTTAAYDTTVTDVLPTGYEPLVAPGGAVATNGATITGSSGSTGTWNSGTRTITWTLAPAIAAAGGTVTLDFDVALDPAASLTDGQDMTTDADIPSYYALPAATRAGISTGDVPEYGNGGTASRGGLLPDTTTVEVHFPELAITKGATDDLSDARFDTPFTWVLLVQNVDDGASAFDVDVEDTLPAGWSYVASSARVTTPYGGPTAIEPTVAGQDLTWPGLVSGSGEPLVPGEQIVIEFDATPDSATLAPDTPTAISNTGTGNPHQNSATVTGDDASGASACCDTGGGPVPYTDTDTADAVIRRIDLSVDKSIVDTPPIYHGDIVTYVIEVTNDGPDEATEVTLTDVFAPDHTFVGTVTIEAGTFTPSTFTWDVGTIPSGTTYELRVQLEVDAAGTVTNTAGVETAGQWDVDSTPGNDLLSEDDEDDVTITALGTDLGNRIWLDLNADGVQDGGEPGIPGVDVAVSWTDADGDPQVRSATTDSDGNWNVDGLPVDTALTVTVDPATPATPAGSGGGGTTLPGGIVPTWELDDNPVVTAPQAGNGHATGLDHESTGIVLTTTTTTYLDVDFGYVGINSLGDELWFDADDGGESAPEPGDQPLVGVDVTLVWAGVDDTFGTGDDLALTDTTDASGLYLFPDLPDGTYRVTIDDTTLPAGTVPTYDLDGPGTAHTSGDVDLGIGQPFAEDRRDVDFAYSGTASLGDTVWFDHDRDGVLDGGEVPIEGVRVTAEFTLPGGLVTSLETTTDADGQYAFVDLPFDIPITVTVDDTTLPAGFAPTYDLDGTLTPHVAIATLTITEPNRVDVDFGYAGAGTIGDLVWLDVDDSGTATPDAGEPGLGGLTVELLWDNPTGGADLVLTTTTDGDGGYVFENLPDGDYTISVTTPPAGVDPTFDADGGLDLTSDTTLAGGGSDLDQDFSFVGTASIGDTVWHDLDADGIVDPDEDRLGGVDVIVTWTDPGTGSTLEFSVTTDPDGQYLLTDLPAGDYVVTVDEDTLPPGFVPTYDLDAGADGTTATDITTGQNRRDVDFGYRLEADLVITKTHSGDFRLGEENEWSISVTNLGPAAAAAPVTITDDLPDGIDFVRAEGDDWDCADADGIVTCTYVDGGSDDVALAAGATSAVSLVVIPDADAAPSVVNTALVDTPTPESDDTNNSDDDEVVIPLAVLRIDKELDGTLRPSDVVTYVITVTNDGPSPTTGTITITDDLPAGLSFVSVSADDALTCSEAASVVSCETDDPLAVDASLQVEIDVRVTASAGTSIENAAEVEGGNVVNGAPLPDAEVLSAGTENRDSDASTVQQPPGVLPFTGSNTVTMLWFAGLLILGGGLVLVLRRRLVATV